MSSLRALAEQIDELAAVVADAPVSDTSALREVLDVWLDAKADGDEENVEAALDDVRDQLRSYAEQVKDGDVAMNKLVATWRQYKAVLQARVEAEKKVR